MAMTSLAGTPSVLSVDTGERRRVAEIDRRFYAFAVDRVIAWGILTAVAVIVARTLLRRHQVLVGVATIVATFLAVGLVLALLQGSTGRTPGKGLTGLRLVDIVTERPIGARRAVLRALVLGWPSCRSGSAWPPSPGLRWPTGRGFGAAGTTGWCPRSWSTSAAHR
jgi:hypothetical protein